MDTWPRPPPSSPASSWWRSAWRWSHSGAGPTFETLRGWDVYYECDEGVRRSWSDQAWLKRVRTVHPLLPEYRSLPIQTKFPCKKRNIKSGHVPSFLWYKEILNESSYQYIFIFICVKGLIVSECLKEVWHKIFVYRFSHLSVCTRQLVSLVPDFHRFHDKGCN